MVKHTLVSLGLAAIVSTLAGARSCYGFWGWGFGLEVVGNTRPLPHDPVILYVKIPTGVTAKPTKKEGSTVPGKLGCGIIVIRS